jgi:hypothetical protein
MVALAFTNVLGSSALYHPPEVSLSKLSDGRRFLEEALQLEGMVLVKEIPEYEKARVQTLMELERCIRSYSWGDDDSDEAATPSSSRNSVRVSTLADGTKRYTIATSSLTNTFDLELEERCPGFILASATLRDINLQVTNSLARSLVGQTNMDAGDQDGGGGFELRRARPTCNVDDSSSSSSGAVLDFASAVETGEHLEHFHVYHQSHLEEEEEEEGTSANEHHQSQNTLEMHTDLGILLSMTPALYMNEEKSQSQSQSQSSSIQEGDPTSGGASGLLVETKEGKVVEVALPSSGILFMLGEGVNMWLNQSQEEAGKKNFHIPKHAMQMPERRNGEAGSNVDNNNDFSLLSRAWYGRMVLPPAHARLQTEDPNLVMTYEEFQNIARRKLEGALQEGDSGLIDALQNVRCSHGRTLKQGLDVQGKDASDDCGEGQIYCWMQCMDPSRLDCTADEVIQCADSEGRIWKNETAQMCPECQLRCEEKPPTPTPTPTPTPPTKKNRLCNPAFSPVSMYMSGFQFGSDADAPCLVYLFPSLVLDTQWKFVLACFATVALALLTDFGCTARDAINRRLSTRLNRNDFVGISFQFWGTAVFTSQAFLSYALMLVAMTYKGELFCSLLAGLAIGYVLFKRGASAHSPELCCSLTLEGADTDMGGFYSHAKERKGRLETNLISLSPSPTRTKSAKGRCCTDAKGKTAVDKGAPNGLGEQNGLLRPEEREEMLDANSPSGSSKRLSNS